MKKISLFFIFIVPYLLFSFDDKIFNEITFIDQNVLKLINNSDENISYKDIFYYYCLVSDCLESYEKYKNWLSKLELEIDKKLSEKFNFKNMESENKEKISEEILIALHNIVLKKYNPYSFKISDTIETNEYSCVSSTILYTIFLKKYNFSFAPIETDEHLFVKIFLNNKSIDVETTSRYGYNVGSKKELYDITGNLIGSIIIPKKEYSSDGIIDIKKMLSIVYYNKYNELINLAYPIKALNSGFLIYKIRGDAKGKTIFETFYYNYLLKLYKESDYFTLIKLASLFNKSFTFSSKIQNIKFEAFFFIVNNYNSYGGFDVVNSYITLEKSVVEKKEDKLKINNLNLILLNKELENFISSQNFDHAYILFDKYAKEFDYQTRKALLYKILEKEFSLCSDLNEILKKINQLKVKYEDIVADYENYYKKLEINKLISQKEFERALQKAKEFYFVNNSESSKNLLINSYLNYSNFLFANKSIEIIELMDNALKIFPNDITLKNNFLNISAILIEELIKEKKYHKARDIYDFAIVYFLDSELIKQYDSILKEKKTN